MSETPSSPERFDRRQGVVLGVIFLFAIFLRVESINTPRLWTDEFVALMQSAGHDERSLPTDGWSDSPPDLISLNDAKPLSAIFDVVGRDTHPPLFVTVLRGWREFFGESEPVARLLSVLISMIGLGVLVDAARRSVGSRPAIWAGAIYAVAGSLVHYGTEIRSYGLLSTLVIAAAWIAIRIRNDGPKPTFLVLLSLTFLAAMLAHYLAVAPLAAIAGVLLVEEQKRTRLCVFVSLALAGVAFVAIQLRTFLGQQGTLTTNLDWLADDRPGLFFRTLARAVELPAKCFAFDSLSPAAVAFFLGGVFLFVACRAGRDRQARLWLAIALAAVVQLAVADMLQGRRSADFVRYAIAAASAFAVVLASAGCRFHWPGVLAIGLGIFAWINDANSLRPDWRGFVSKVESVRAPGEPLAVIRTDENDWRATMLYLGLCAYGEPRGPLMVVDFDQVAAAVSSRAEPTILAIDASQAPAGRVLFELEGVGRATRIDRE